MAAASNCNVLDSKYLQKTLINYSKSFLLKYFVISEILEVFRFRQIKYISFLFHYNRENFYYFFDTAQKALQ